MNEPKKIPILQVMGKNSKGFLDGDWILSEDMSDDGEIGIVQLKHIGNGEFLKKDFEFITEKKCLELNCTRLVEGDLLVSRMADPIGRSCILPKLDFPTVTVVDATIIRPDPNIADSEYLNYVINTEFFQNQAKKYSVGTTRARISRKNLEKLTVPLPSLTTQDKIVSIMNKAANIRKWRKESDNLIDSCSSNLFLKMFGDPEKNPKRWNIVKIDDGIQDSQYGTSVKSNPNGRGYPIVGMSNITYDGRLDFSKYSHVELPKEEFEKLKLHDGDVIFNRTNSTELVGKTTYWSLDVEAVLASYLVKLRLKDNTNPIFFTYLMNTRFFKQLFSMRCKKAVNQSNISPTLLKKFDMFLPPIEFQNKFASVVKQVEKMKPFRDQSKRQIDNLFNVLIQKALRGELGC